MKQLARMMSYLKPHWATVLATFLAMVIQTVMEPLSTMILRAMVDEGLPSRDMSLIASLCLWYIAIYAIKGLVNWIQWYGSELTGQKVTYDLRQSVHDHLQKLPPSYFNTMGSGQVMSRLTSDIESMQNFVGWGALLLTNMVMLFIVSSAFLAYLNWKLTLAMAVTFPFLARTVFWFDKHVRKAWQNVREKMGHLTTALQENISGINVVKAFAREELEMEKFRAKNLAHYEANMERASVEAKGQPLLDLISGFVTVIVIGYGGYLVTTGRMTMGTIFAFYSMSWTLIWPVRMMGWLVNMAEQAIAAAPRVFELLDHQPEIKDEPGAVDLEEARGHIVFDDVSFSFPDDSRETLKDIDLEILPGETVAIVGGTGSGKSTLVNMIPRFVQPTKGRILLDGRDIREITLKSLRKHIGLVLQDNFLFSATVKENIALGKRDATGDEIQKAARLAQAEEFIDELPKKYDTPVGERGIGLSGGQKQRIALARALLVNPRILILDEATSSVDTETEYLIQEGLQEVMKGRTSIVIAKRLSTIRGADKIVILDKGRILQVGTHEELLKQGGFYRKLFESQFAEEDVEKAIRLELAEPANGETNCDNPKQ